MTKTYINAVSNSRSSGNRGALLSPINKGEALNLRPSDEAMAKLQADGVTHMEPVWEMDDGVVTGVVLKPATAKSNGVVRIRHEGNQRPRVVFGTGKVGKAMGSAVQPNETVNADGSIHFAIPAELTFECAIPAVLTFEGDSKKPRRRKSEGQEAQEA